MMLPSADNKATPRIHALDKPTVDIIRACAVIPNFSSVLQELVLNSLDAKSTEINVKINYSTYSVTVIDNGSGIVFEDLCSHLGQFHVSSNICDEKTYGCRGEALASIAKLSSLSIWSSTNSDNSFQVSFIDSVPSSTNYVRRVRGTTMTASDIFSCLQVRQKSTKPLSETIKIKEFMKSISMLHYNVEFILTDCTSDSEMELLHIIPQVSIAARFGSTHSNALLSKMTSVSVNYDVYSLRGLLSPPSGLCCHWNRDCQYLFVNQRWIRPNHSLARLIEKIFISVLHLRSGIGGPSPMHHSSSVLSRAIHPLFVLQLSCPSDVIDVLSEKDKMDILFRDWGKVLECVRLLLRDLFSSFDDSLSETLDEIWMTEYNSLSNDNCTPGTVQLKSVDDELGMVTKIVRRKTPSFQPDSPAIMSASTTSHCASESQQSVYTSSQNAPFYEVMHGEREAIFPNSSSGTITPRPLDFSFEDIFCFSLSALSELQRYSLSAPDSTVDSNCTEIRESSKKTNSYANHHISRKRRPPIDSDDNYGESVENRTSINNACAEDDSNHLAVAPRFGVKLTRNNQLEQRIDSLVTEEFLIPVCEEGFGESAVQIEVELSYQDSGVAKYDIFEEVDSGAALTRDHLDNTVLPSQNATSARTSSSQIQVSLALKGSSLSKDLIRTLRCVGQAENKYILAISAGTSQLIVLDQHAADERVNLEAMCSSICPCRLLCLECYKKDEFVWLPSSQQIDFLDVDLTILQSDYSRRILRHWNFNFSLGPVSRSSVDRITSIIQGISDCILLHSVPVILGEELTAQDFVEFVRWISDNPIAPFHAIRPPAVLRIFAFRACRTSVRFGDSLTPNRCSKLLRDLADTQLPFQCAHGRPSIFPLADLKHILVSRQREQAVSRTPQFI